jgi:hypothetical protein
VNLQITAYSGLLAMREIAVAEDPRAVHDGLTFAVHPWFSRHADGVDARLVYRACRQFEFDAGAFSRHVGWLETLARLIGIESLDLFWRSPQPGPFAELLNFTDGDATIGPSMCAKLGRDFAQWAHLAARHQNRQFRLKYALWRHAFETGASDGCVSFSARGA